MSLINLEYLIDFISLNIVLEDFITLALNPHN
jgi:hypothetical protein